VEAEMANTTALEMVRRDKVNSGSFVAQCGRCLRLSRRVDAVSAEHAWSELLRDGWTWYADPLAATRYASCLDCLRRSSATGVSIDA
jgi:hypothetical protein